MPKLSSSFVVNRPVEDVFAYLASYENHLNYEQGLVEAEQTSEGSFALGTTSRDVRQAMGKKMESTSRIAAFEPNKSFTFESTSGPMDFRGTWSFEPVEGTTKVSFDMGRPPEGTHAATGATHGRQIKKRNGRQHRQNKEHTRVARLM